MSGGKGGSKSTTTSSVSVPKYLENELQYGLSESRSLYDQGAPSYYSGQTYADFTPDQISAMNATRERATNGSPLVQSAQDLTQKTINGDFLNNNPYLDQIMERYGAKANSQALSTFNKAGRLGSGANVAAAGQAITDATMPFLMQNYQNERGLQQNAVNAATGLADYDYKDLAALSGVGDAQQQQDQRGIDEDVARYQYEAQAPSNWLDQYLARVNGSGANNLTTTTQTEQTKKSGGLGSVLGTALALGSMFVPGGQFASFGSSIGGGLSSFLGGLGASGAATGAAGLTSTGLSGFGGASNAMKSFVFK